VALYTVGKERHDVRIDRAVPRRGDRTRLRSELRSVGSDGEGISQCHLVAESGAAAVALMFATTSSDRLLSLNDLRTPWIGADFQSEVDVEFRQAAAPPCRLPR